jgi:hypothetical protein
MSLFATNDESPNGRRMKNGGYKIPEDGVKVMKLVINPCGDQGKHLQGRMRMHRKILGIINGVKRQPFMLMTRHLLMLIGRYEMHLQKSRKRKLFQPQFRIGLMLAIMLQYITHLGQLAKIRPREKASHEQVEGEK